MADDNRGRNGALAGALVGASAIAATVGFITAAPVTAVIAGSAAIIAGSAGVGGWLANRGRNDSLYTPEDTLLDRVRKVPHDAARMAIDNQARADAQNIQNRVKEEKLKKHTERIHAAEMALVTAAGALELNRVQDHAEEAAFRREQLKEDAALARDKERDDAAVKIALNNALIKDGKYDLLLDQNKPSKRKGFFSRFSRSGKATEAAVAGTAVAEPATASTKPAEDKPNVEDSSKQQAGKAEVMAPAVPPSVVATSHGQTYTPTPVNVTIHNSVEHPVNEQEFQKQATQLLTEIEDHLKKAGSTADKEKLIAQANVLLDGFSRDNSDPAQMTFSSVTSIGEVSNDSKLANSPNADMAVDQKLLVQMERINILLRERIDAQSQSRSKSSYTLVS